MFGNHRVKRERERGHSRRRRVEWGQYSEDEGVKEEAFKEKTREKNELSGLEWQYTHYCLLTLLMTSLISG